MMFAMGLTATSVMFAYWYWKMTPYKPLQQALVEEYGKTSAPRVDGGREKGKKKNPFILLVQMRASFDPTLEDAITTEKLEAMLNRTHELAAERIDLSTYEEYHLFLYHERQGKDVRKLLTVRRLEAGQMVFEPEEAQ